MLQAHEEGETEFNRFQEEYKPYLYDQFCSLDTGPSAGSPYMGIENRDQAANTPNSQQGIEEPGSDQQPNFGDLYPARTIVK
eukprot:13174488-Ditylum_brightwellii.AAC.1